jgi:hypothetical protein
MSNNAGFVSLAHFRTDWMSFTKPVSFGFSRPRRRRFFITATNSRLLSWPSTVIKGEKKTSSLVLLKWNGLTKCSVSLNVLNQREKSTCSDNTFHIKGSIFTRRFRLASTYDFHQKWWTPHWSHGHWVQHGQLFLQHASELLKQYKYCKYYQTRNFLVLSHKLIFTLVNGSTSYVVKCQRRIHIINVI